jgi:hypothetical protein
MAYSLPANRKVVVTAAKYFVIDTGGFPTNFPIGLRLIAQNLKGEQGSRGIVRPIGTPHPLSLATIPRFEWLDLPLPANPGERTLDPADLIAFQFLVDIPPLVQWTGGRFMFEIEVR